MLALFIGEALPIEAAVTAVLGGAMAGYGIAFRSDARAMQSWPEVSGVVSQASVEEFFESGGTSDDFGQTMYRPLIAYDYVVDGHEYRGHRIGAARTSASWRSHAESILARYPLNQSVTVYYNPADPKDALLERATAPAWAATIITLGLLLAIGGLAWMFMPLAGVK